jgi:hypothetical protein
MFSYYSLYYLSLCIICGSGTHFHQFATLISFPLWSSSVMRVHKFAQNEIPTTCPPHLHGEGLIFLRAFLSMVRVVSHIPCRSTVSTISPVDLVSPERYKYTYPAIHICASDVSSVPAPHRQSVLALDIPDESHLVLKTRVVPPNPSPGVC